MRNFINYFILPLSMKLVYNYNLAKSISYKKIDNFLEELQKTYSDRISSPNHYWNSSHTQMYFSVVIMGFNTKGTIYLKKDKITMEAEIPFLAVIFSRTIKEMIGKQLDALLSSAPQQKHL